MRRIARCQNGSVSIAPGRAGRAAQGKFLDTSNALVKTPSAPEREALLEALLQATVSLAGSQNVQSILKNFCDALVKASPHLRMAWVYLGDRHAEVIKPQYAAGPGKAHAERIAIGRDDRSMQGPARMTLATGQPVIMRVAMDEGFSLWRGSALAEEIKVVASIAFHAPDSDESGLLAIGADREDFFDEVGLEPILAFARLGEVALAQAADRRKLEELATYDHLTGLYNRRAFEALLQQEHARAVRSGQPYSVFLCDLDHFKLINDNYGHEIGDRVLKQAAQIARTTLRQGDYLGRWGGEEFICLLPETSGEKALLIAERLRQRISERPIAVLGHQVKTSISIGVATYPREGQNPTVLLGRVDAQLYHAKREGRNRVSRATERNGNIFSLVGQVEAALNEGRIKAAYQAIVDLQSRAVVAEESLVRLLLPGGALLEAGKFIEAASQFELIHRLDQEVMQQTLLRCARHVLEKRELLHFVNASADFLRRPEQVRALLRYAQAQCPGCGQDSGEHKPLVIEITERELLGDPKQATHLVTPFLDFGLRLAVDDFGSGYSSFKYLADLPVSFLKIEGELVKRVGTERKIRAIIRSIQNIAQDLGLITVAEFVENEETAAILQDIGIDWGQGYYFGRPVLDET